MFKVDFENGNLHLDSKRCHPDTSKDGTHGVRTNHMGLFFSFTRLECEAMGLKPGPRNVEPCEAFGAQTVVHQSQPNTSEK